MNNTIVCNKFSLGMLTKKSKLDIKEIFKDEFQEILEQKNIRFIFSNDKYIEIINSIFNKNFKNEKGIKIKLENIGDSLIILKLTSAINKEKLDLTTYSLYKVSLF